MATDSLNVANLMEEIRKIPTVPSMRRVSSEQYQKLNAKQTYVSCGMNDRI